MEWNFQYSIHLYKPCFRVLGVHFAGWAAADSYRPPTSRDQVLEAKVGIQAKDNDPKNSRIGQAVDTYIIGTYVIQ